MRHNVIGMTKHLIKRQNAKTTMSSLFVEFMGFLDVVRIWLNALSYLCSCCIYCMDKRPFSLFECLQNSKACKPMTVLHKTSDAREKGWFACASTAMVQLAFMISSRSFRRQLVVAMVPALNF